MRIQPPNFKTFVSSCLVRVVPCDNLNSQAVLEDTRDMLEILFKARIATPKYSEAAHGGAASGDEAPSGDEDEDDDDGGGDDKNGPYSDDGPSDGGVDPSDSATDRDGDSKPSAQPRPRDVP